MKGIVMRTNLFSAAVFAALLSLPLSGQSPLPNPAPFAKAMEAEHMVPQFSLKTFPLQGRILDCPEFISGNKEISIRRQGGRVLARDNAVHININGRKCGSISFWGALGGENYGFPFAELKEAPPSLSFDRKQETVTYKRPYLRKDGSRGEFIYTLKKLKNGKIELAWSTGSGEQVCLWFGLTDDVRPGGNNVYRGKTIRIGEKAVVQHSREDLLNKKAKSEEYSGDIRFNADDPLNGCTLEMGDLKGFSWERVTPLPKEGIDRYELSYRTQGKSSGKLLIDLGKSAVRSTGNTPPPVGGIDHWKNDGIHIPLSPVRNIMPNPSFERGLRFWTWAGGGARYNEKEPQNRFETVDGGLFGKKALLIRPIQNSAAGLVSFPMPLERGQKYTLSCYVKTAVPTAGKGIVRLQIANAAAGGTIKSNGPFGDNSPDSRFSVGKDWTRISRTFTADAMGLKVYLQGNNCLFDGLQLEKGDKTTEFVAPPLEGVLQTSNPDNDLKVGEAFNGGFRIAGEPGVSGKVKLQFINAYKEIVFEKEISVKIPMSGELSVPINPDLKKIGRGVFVVKAEYSVPGFALYWQYERFSILKPLSNTHASKNLFGLLCHAQRISRGEDLMRKLMEWGWGSTSHMPLREKIENSATRYLYDKYRFSNRISCGGEKTLERLFPDEKNWWQRHVKYRSLKKFTPEQLKIADSAVFDFMNGVSEKDVPFVAFSNEEESSPMIAGRNFDEYFKIQHTFAKAAKRANPNFKVAPTHGTSGYSILRGFEPYEGYLSSAHKAGFKYDAVSIHPYGNIDGGTLGSGDADTETARLIEQMKRYGYGKETPILMGECFNKPETYIPEWGAGGAYDNYQSGKLTYDFGNREFIHAASLARMYIVYLKYWPQVDSVNCWIARPFMDQHLTPTLACHAVNTLGNFFPWVEYKADARPAPGMRGYIFKLRDGSGIAPLWCIDSDVENGFKSGPVLNVKFGQPVEIFDFMGNRRSFTTEKDGSVPLQLTPAPLYIKAKHVDQLAKALQNGISNDSASCLKVTFAPDAGGRVSVLLKNLTGREQKGRLTVNGKVFQYAVPGAGEQKLTVETLPETAFGKLYRKAYRYSVTPEKGNGNSDVWDMDYFFVPKVSGAPDWNKIPSLPFPNWHERKPASEKDLSACYQTAWDAKNFYLRVTVRDDKLLDFPDRRAKPSFLKNLYSADGCLEVYFDCGANARSNLIKNYDQDDYRYDFAPPAGNKDGRGHVWRLVEVYHQLADGINMPKKEEASKKIICDFKRTADGYLYTITFGQRYIEPIVLRKGFISGFALYLHDQDEPDGKNQKAITTSTKKGAHCQYLPQFWPLMIFAE